ncbi:hypothetical protein [Allokutzneria sp. NRRL B-24872]|uniref:hypothetical protein n=1 Tax=Allokutzneria sp. NRRL B-24872 TaxID=1137961 RepID=UPI000A38AD81|nr:hypothetical protein [Allokutzneria sp. NRRL B-24872]
MKTGHKKRAAVVAGLVSVVGLIGSGSVSAAPQSGATTDKYCMTTIKKLKPGQTESEVVSRKCGHEAVVAARAAGSTALLVTLFEHNHYTGNWEDFYGQDGPCDHSGYGINSVSMKMENATSSLISNAWCNNITLYNWVGRDPRGGTYRLLSFGTFASYFEALPGFNDMTSSLHLSRR